MKKNFNSTLVNNQKVNNKTQIECEIEAIFKFLVDEVSESSVVKKESLSRWTSCCEFISIYRNADLRKEAAIGKAHKGNVRPIVSFGFYPSVYQPERLGSIAIYGEDAMHYCRMLEQSRSIFGYKILRVKTEMGMRLFVDVKLRA